MIAIALPWQASAVDTELTPETREMHPDDEVAVDAILRDLDALEAVSLEALLDVRIITATKTAESASEAPAIIAVITGDELERRGCRSLVDALTHVPGLIINTDLAFYNVGVRGVSGGLRGGSRHLKFLINGQPVAFRSDAQNLIGPEFIPVSAIEQIEVIRGPASSLYGLNAFLGVVNVITKRSAPVDRRGSLRAELGTRGRGYLGGAEITLGHRQEHLDIFIAAAMNREDRSGLRLPKNSPNLNDYEGNRTSINDTTGPRSVFASINYDLEGFGEFKAQAVLQELLASSEYADTGAMSHETTVHLRNFALRLDYNIALAPVLLRAFIAAGTGEPGSEDRVLPIIRGEPTGQMVERDFSFRSITAGVEPQVLISESSITLGAEVDFDHENLRRNIYVSRDTGQRLPGNDFGEKDFNNLGVYLQGLFREFDQARLSANLRYDVNNQFGNNLDFRAAAVVGITDGLYMKFLVGNSYRAPSPEQLYGSPTRPGGVQGALVSAFPAPLRSQTAMTHEALIGYGGENYRFSIAGYHSAVNDRIEYVRKEGDLQAANLADSTTVGAEVSMRAAWRGLLDVTDIQLQVNGSYVSTEFDIGKQLTPREQGLVALNELYPPWTVGAIIDVSVPEIFLRLNVDVLYYARRLQSQTNQSIGRPLVGDPLRYIKPSYPVNITLSTEPLELLKGTHTRFLLSVRNAFDTASVEPGFNGINIPSLGRRVIFSMIQEL